MTSIPLSRLRAARAIAHGIVRPRQPDAAGVVRHMLAMQGQDFPAVCWAMGLRSRGGISSVRAAFDDGSLVRSWPLRGTLHVVSALDLPWILPITAPRQLRAARTRHEALGLTSKVFDRARDAAVAALAGGTALGRAEFGRMLSDAGIDVAGQRAYHLIWQLALTGTVVWGPTRDGAQLLVLSDEWLPRTEAVDPDDALGRLLTRYLAGRGPASLDDFAWWAGVTKSQAATAHAVVRERLMALRCGDSDLWAFADAIIPTGPSPAVALLPGFDEYLLGYRDRRHVLAARHADTVVPGGNGVFQPMLVARGEVIGVWRRQLDTTSLGVLLRPFRPLSVAEVGSAGAAARRYTRFLDLDDLRLDDLRLDESTTTDAIPLP